MRGRVELKTTFRVRPYTEILNGSMPKEGSQQIIGFFIMPIFYDWNMEKCLRMNSCLSRANIKCC